ncbi:DUF7689 domain-containing protein [Limnoglobus roseus]|uniref:DUF7689 domain-containing protein n=1 Tax=Limnoglobus roseus TaxID=2598579 RepID=A0A5C1A8U5_9BACT|nr:hypothetical protein [Limnoglobus roseus]QEL15769.1 hypothetical protein PX52LOC_02705 [Limnoglobus roseus]
MPFGCSSSKPSEAPAANCPPGSTAPCPKAKTPMDKTKFPDQRFDTDPSIKKAFPKLGDNYEVEAPATEDYNCIAHTLGDHGNWVNPETGPKANPLSEMDKKYEALGYKRATGMDTSLEPGTEKVVVYATKNPDGTIKDVTHGAIQRPDGTYSSKLGSMPQIRHENPEALSGPAYGEPVAVYTKK